MGPDSRLDGELAKNVAGAKNTEQQALSHE